jgi:hypothetical protein
MEEVNKIHIQQKEGKNKKHHYIHNYFNGIDSLLGVPG